MKVAMLVEDRDTGYIFLDPAKAPQDAMPVEFTLGDGVLWENVGNDELVVWLSTDTSIRVVRRETVDFKASFDDGWPIPSCLICMTENDYEALKRDLDS